MMLFCSMISCNNSENKTSKKNTKESELSELQKFTIDTSGLSILWTAYKFTDKMGVSGTFNKYLFEPKNTLGTISHILNKSKLSLQTVSVNSADPIRDFKLNTYFFKTFNTSKITGIILKAKDGEGLIDLKMNRISKKIPFSYAIENDTVRLFTHINLIQWKAEEALKTLNTECYELHKGTDGVSKLWPEVDVVIKIPLQKKRLVDL